MKIFAIYTKVELIKQPPWLDEFRERFDEPWHFHNTLKQPCFIAEKEIPTLRKQVGEFFSNQTISDGPLPISFDAVVLPTDQNDITIMVRSRKPGQLLPLQQKLVSVLSEYTDYVNSHHREYENSFDPHITIGRDLSNQQYEEALKYLEDGCDCQGLIKEVVLAVVADDTVEEGMNPANQTSYKL